MRRLTVVLLVLAVLGAGCSGDDGAIFATSAPTTTMAAPATSAMTAPPSTATSTTTTTTSTTLPPTTTTTLPPAIPVAGWEGEGIRQVWVSVEFDYPSATPGLSELVEQALREVGVTPMREADAVLLIQMTGSPLSAQYTDMGTCYTGARLSGNARLSAPGQQELVVAIEGDAPTPFLIYADECGASPEDAPFAAAFAVPLVVLMSALFEVASVPYLTSVVGTEPVGWLAVLYAPKQAALRAFRELDREAIAREVTYRFLAACIDEIPWVLPDESGFLDDESRAYADDLRLVLLDYSDTDYGFVEEADVDEWWAWLDEWRASQED